MHKDNSILYGIRKSNSLRRLFSNRTKRYNRSKTGNMVLLLLVAIFGLFSVLPLLMAINQAFKPLDELFMFPPRIFVTNPTLNNFIQLFNLMNTTYVPFTRYIFNTLLVTAFGTVGYIVVASMAAYPLAKHKVPGANFLFTIVFISIMFYPAVGDVANYITMSAFRWTNTYLAMMVPALGGGFGLFIMRQFMATIPDSLIESGRIEGISEYKIFWYIVFPITKPGWLTLSLFSFQALWNSTFSTYIFSDELKTLPYALSQIVKGGIVRAGAGAAAGVVMMVVPVTFFAFSQNSIVETLSSSGLKE